MSGQSLPDAATANARARQIEVIDEIALAREVEVGETDPHHLVRDGVVRRGEDHVRDIGHAIEVAGIGVYTESELNHLKLRLD